MTNNGRFPRFIAMLSLLAVLPICELSYSQNVGKQNLSTPDFTRVRNKIQAIVDEKISPGVSVLVAHRGSIVFREARGRLAVTDAVQIASMTKSAVASAIMVLIDQQKLSLEDPISKFLTEFRNTPIENVTVRQLLCHTSGVSGALNPTLSLDFSRPATHSELAKKVAQVELIGAPGEFNYADRNYDLLCAIVEKAGLTFEQYIQTSLFEPLGMTSSFIHQGMECVSCGGGLQATLDDVYALYQMHLNGGNYRGKQILSSSAINEMHKQQASGILNDKTFVKYGLGFFLDRVTPEGNARTIYHSGAMGTLAWVDFDTGSVGVLFFDALWQSVKPVAFELQNLIRETVVSTPQ